MIKLFITDIDGVWTDGGMYYDKTGNEFKKFNTSDSAGVFLLRVLDIPTAVMTGENIEIVHRRIQKLKIPYYFPGAKNKLQLAEQMCKDLSIHWDEIAFIGDDINDLPLLRKAGLSAAPINAPAYIQSEVDWIIPVKGGDGAYRAFVEKYLSENNLLHDAIEKFLHQHLYDNQGS